jgi:hypothetical protein
MLTAIRTSYKEHGIKAFYQNFGDNYRNPHEGIIVKLLHQIVLEYPINFNKVLDLAGGSGEVTLALRTLGYEQVEGIEPYTFNAYQQRTGKVAEKFTFEEIEQGILAAREYTIIICSFALHLVQPSRLPTLAYQLSRLTPLLLIITPNKKPILQSRWGWQLTKEWLIERVRGRLYQSTFYSFHAPV